MLRKRTMMMIIGVLICVMMCCLWETEAAKKQNGIAHETQENENENEKWQNANENERKLGKERDDDDEKDEKDEEENECHKEGCKKKGDSCEGDLTQPGKCTQKCCAYGLSCQNHKCVSVYTQQQQQQQQPSNSGLAGDPCTQQSQCMDNLKCS